MAGGDSRRPPAGSCSSDEALILREALQTLREPMESGYVALSRTKGTTYYPAMFQMVMAANPCPCGYAYGNGERCVCKEKDRIRYFARLFRSDSRPD